VDDGLDRLGVIAIARVPPISARWWRWVGLCSLGHLLGVVIRHGGRWRAGM